MDSLLGKPEPSWGNAKFALGELVDKIRANGAKPVIVFIPFIEVLEDRETSDKKLRLIQEFGEEKGILVIDPTNALLNEEEKGSKVYYRVFDTHTNAEGNKVIAEEIAKNWNKIVK